MTLIVMARAGITAHARLSPASQLMSTSSLQAIYHVRSDAQSIEQRAHAIAIEQSVEMPLTAIEDEYVLSEIVGSVEAIDELENGLFAVRIALAAATVGQDP